jgi:hypothetical protein
MTYLDLVGIIIAISSFFLVITSVIRVQNKLKAERKLKESILKEWENYLDTSKIKSDLIEEYLNNFYVRLESSSFNLESIYNKMSVDDQKKLRDFIEYLANNMDEPDRVQIIEGLNQPSNMGKLKYAAKLIDEAIIKEDKIWQSRIWSGKAMSGRWDGIGKWYLEDKRWIGIGSWAGGLLLGKWNAEGKWEVTGNGKGTMKGEGQLEANIEFLRYFAHLVIIISITIITLISLLGHFMANFEAITIIIIALFIIALTIIVYWYTLVSSRGKLWLNGTWEDIGEFRILDITGQWRIGYHTGTWNGKMKDLKPK